MSGDGSGRRRHVHLLGHLACILGAPAVLTTLYYVAPLDHGFNVLSFGALLAGLVLFGALVGWQASAISRSEYPRLRALEALATAVPLFLLLFSASYVLLSDGNPQSFSEPLNRTSALYFTVTVFATVGFGDIVPTTPTGRVLTTLQMVADLVVVGIVAKVLFGAVRIGLTRRPGGYEP
ncbi:potassium channel family protein [Streptomyces sp. AB3(2024)]|uniref:potassium channel family protein n=1 Tax=Streptomyces sp. AB3(2024) TaxID=3317321 RepID=UPI0035A262E5